MADRMKIVNITFDKEMQHFVTYTSKCINTYLEVLDFEKGAALKNRAYYVVL